MQTAAPAPPEETSARRPAASQLHLLPHRNHDPLRRADEKLRGLMYELSTSNSLQSSTGTVTRVPKFDPSARGEGV